MVIVPMVLSEIFSFGRVLGPLYRFSLLQLTARVKAAIRMAREAECFIMVWVCFDRIDSAFKDTDNNVDYQQHPGPKRHQERTYILSLGRG